jgi:hypothetical protein
MLFNINNFSQYEKFVPEHLRVKWERNLLKSVLVEIAGYFIVPFASLFVVKRLRKDVVKRHGKKTVNMMREYLHPFFNWLQTDDNAQDEFWYGKYQEGNDFGANWTQKDYDNSRFIRYYCRVMWGWRNNSYGYLYYTLGIKHEPKPIKSMAVGLEDNIHGWLRIDIYRHYFQYQEQRPIGNGEYNSYNFGHKAHKSAPVIESTGKKNVMYANRIFFNTKKYK